MHSLLSCANRFEGGVDAPIPPQLTVDRCAPCARVTFVSLGLLPNSRMREHRRLLGAVVIVLQLVVSQAVRSSLPLNLPVYAPCSNSARLHHELPMQKTRLPVCTVGDETCQLPCGPCNTRAFIYESAAARLAFTNVIHDRNTTVMSLEVRVALRAVMCMSSLCSLNRLECVLAMTYSRVPSRSIHLSSSVRSSMRILPEYH